MKVDPRAEREQIERLNAFRAQRNNTDVKAALANLAETARGGSNIMPASILCAHAGVTTGEWSQTLRDIFGEYRAPTGIDIPANDDSRSAQATAIPAQVAGTAQALGRPLRLLGVTASNLVPSGGGQGLLFPDAGRERDRKLDRILDQVHGKFGPMLRRGAERD